MSTPALSLFDTHAHLDFEKFQDDFPSLLQRAQDAGVGEIVTIGASRGFDSNLRALKIAEQHDWIYASVGIHPHDARISTEEGFDAQFEQLRGFAQDHSRVVAVGETGLDYHYDHSPREVQKDLFRAFIRLARETSHPIIVHTREAEDDTIAILREEGADQCGGIIHCFSGTSKLADAALELGMYISFSGIVTFRSAREIQEVAKTTPMDRILVETDAPYLAPVPKRGRRNEPAFVEHTLRCIAELRGEDPVELAAATTENARRVYGLGG